MSTTTTAEPLLAMCRGALPAGIFSPSLFSHGDNPEFSRYLKKVDAWASANVSSERFDRAGSIPEVVLRSAAGQGLFGATIPSEFGGLGLSMSSYSRLASLLAYHDPSLAITVGAHSSIATKGILMFGNEEQKRRFLPHLASGRWIGAFCLTEENAGSDAQAIEATALPDGKGYLLNGRKIFSTNAGIAHVFTVFARDGATGRICAFLVTADQPGLERREGAEKLGLRGANVGSLLLRDVLVPPENVLGNPGEGFRMALRTLNAGRLGLAASYMGAIRLTLERSLDYASRRTTFGRPLLENELVAAMLVEMGDHLFALESMTFLASGLWDSGTCEPGLEAALNKIYASESAWLVADMALQLHGGNGYMRDWPLERMLRDVRIGRIFEGPNEILRLFVASKILKEKAIPWHTIGERRKKASGLADRAAVLARMGLVWARERTRASAPLELRRDELSGSLAWEGRCLAEAVAVFRQTCARLLTRYRRPSVLAERQLHLARLADMALHTWRMTAVVARMNARQAASQVRADESATALRVLSHSLRAIERLRVEIRDDVGQDALEAARNLKKYGRYPFAFHEDGGTHG